MIQYDLIVIGAGSGGMATARRAAEFGAKVLVIEKSELGGTCVNRGCVPKKVMWNAAYLQESMELSTHYGFRVKDTSLDWLVLKQKRDEYIKRLNGIYEKNLNQSKVKIVCGEATFASANEVKVNDKLYSAPHILIAVGGQPKRPSVPGAELASTSDDFFKWEALPKKVLVVGSGYIGVEISGVLQALGSQVHLITRGQRILSSFDEEIAAELHNQMLSSGIKIATQSRLASISKSKDYYTVNFEDGTEDHFDQVLLATGREPLTQALNLDSAGLSTNEYGFISVDEYQNTNSNGIYAVGDVTGQVELTPVAIAAGRKLAHRLFNQEKKSRLDYENVASVIFSHPPIGTVGLSESAAREKYGEKDIKVYKSKFINMLYSPMPQDKKPFTLYKLVCQGKNEKVVGIHIIGTASDEVIQGFAVALKMGATKSDLDDTIAIHPTAAEELVTMR